MTAPGIVLTGAAWAVSSLPELSGSERQIQWASNIRAAKVREILAALDSLRNTLVFKSTAFALPAADSIAKAQRSGLLQDDGALAALAGTDLRAVPYDTALAAILTFGRARWDWVLQETRASWWIDHRTQPAAALGLDPAAHQALDTLAFFRAALDEESPPPARKVRLPIATIRGHVMLSGHRQRAQAQLGIKDGLIYPALDGWCLPDPLRVLWDGTIIGVPGMGKFFPERGEIDRLGIICEDA